MDARIKSGHDGRVCCSIQFSCPGRGAALFALLRRAGPTRAARYYALDVIWVCEVTKMIKLYGAPIDDADVGRIVDYLAATY
jgi:uncharacterized protein (DUF697 family)